MLEFLLNKELTKASLLKRDSNTSVFCEYCGIFKITCFGGHLRTDASVRVISLDVLIECYFSLSDALSRIIPYMDIAKRRLLMNSFFASQFNYCPLVWMCHHRSVNNKINRLQG